MNDIPYREISPLQKEWLFLFVRWWSEMIEKDLREFRDILRPELWNNYCRWTKKNFKEKSSYGIKHILEGGWTERDAFLEKVFNEYEFSPFYCTNATFKQAMEDCRVRHTKRYCGNYYFLGGYENV